MICLIYEQKLFLNAAIDKVNKIFLANYQNNVISRAFDELIQKIQEEFFTEDLNYFIMLHFFTFADDIVRKYVNFTRDDTNNAYQILRANREYGNIVSSIMNIIRNTANIIKSNIELEDEYVNFYLYLSIKEKLIEKYSAIWVNEYDNTYNCSDLKKYLIYCANECYITLNDNRSIFHLLVIG